MQLQRQSNGKLIDLGTALAGGGEGQIYTVSQEPSLVAKIYHKPTSKYTNKLNLMLANPPNDPAAGQGRVSIAWPVDLLFVTGGNQQIAGFLMRRVTQVHPIHDFYNPKSRRQHSPFFNYLYLLRTARNLAAAVQSLHASGYVIGDVNESNILLAETALVTLVDTDSFQVRDSQKGVVHRCRVGKPEFTPPELQGKTFSDIDRTPQHDRFGLAVLIF
jgi:DNA-binding helix-hairpin-helix protein with protein kinase domain